MNVRSLRFCAWCGPAFTVLFAVGFWPVAGLVPPPSPALGSAAIAAFYSGHAMRIHLGVQLGMIASALFLPFVGLISVQLKRIEGRYSPLAYAQLAAGTGSTMVFLFPLMNLQSAAFRADRAPDLVQAISDMSWIPFVGLLCLPAMQNLCLAVGILSDSRERPVFPRWAGFLNIWVGAAYLPAMLLVFVHSGPVAWNGIFSWWLGAAAFFLWILVMTPLLLQAIDNSTFVSAGGPAHEGVE